MAQSLSTTPILDGYLYKKGVINTSWKRRYFVLYNDRTIDYFKDKSHSMQRNKAKGTIKLARIQKVDLLQFIHTKTTITKNNPCALEHLYTHSTDVISSIHPPPSYSNIVKSEHIPAIDQKDNASIKKCDRPYAFALISNSREWKLSAENEEELKQWITTLSTLCQGDEIFNGYLNDNSAKTSSKHFVLYKNKVLNCYNTNHKIEFDVDLKHLLYLKYDRNISIELAIAHRKQNILLTAPNKQNAHDWYKHITSLFAEKEIIRCLYDTLTESVHIKHDKKQMTNTYIAIYRPYIVLFDDETQYKFSRNMLFFDRRMFRDYLLKQKCILIPVNENIKWRKSQQKSQQTTPYVLTLSNIVGDRKWSISVASKKTFKQILQFIDVLDIGRYKKRTENKETNVTLPLAMDDNPSIPYSTCSGISLPTIEETRASI